MNQNNKSPFHLDNEKEYQRWRELKLERAQKSDTKPVINIKKTPPTFYAFLNTPTPADTIDNEQVANTQAFLDSIHKECEADNYCIYSINDHENYSIKQTKQIVQTLAMRCGLSNLDDNICADDDGLTSVCINIHADQHEYIPYTNKKLNWHTDGYYNDSAKTINSMLLHCYQAAEQGGESAFLDHEIAYILLRDENPLWIEALSKLNVMTIPANILNGKVIRKKQSGPVFSLSANCRLHMRYSARTKNIIWKQDNFTQDAISFLQNLLNVNEKSVNKSKESNYIKRYMLKAGEGIISRNILHCRTSFDDMAQQRLLFRGRYYDELSTVQDN